MYVTIAIPFYNAEAYLLDAIKSVFAQTHQKWELILLDDGSTDKSLEIAQSITDPRVRVYSDGKNKKLAARLNEITKLAKYDYIARMDADDLMSPERIGKQIEILKKNPNIDIISTGLISIDEMNRPIGMRWHHSNLINFDEIINKKGCGIVHASIIGKKEWFKKNPYNESLLLAQDYDLWVRSSYNNDLNVFLIKEPLYYYREEMSSNARKALLAYKYERVLFRKFLKNNKKLLLKSYFKSLTVFIFDSMHLHHLIVRNRNKQKIDNKQKIKYYKNLEKIKKIKIND